jgi:hypothetical protein
VLDVTPNDLLLAEEQPAPDDQDHWLSRLNATARRLQTDDLMPAVRIELTTYRLQGGCSTAELSRPGTVIA